MSKGYDLIKAIDNEETRLIEYEELIVKRDELLKAAGSYLTVYTAEFGDMLNANFELKIECIKKKKAINYCRRRMNRGLSIDADRMKAEIELEMKLYNDELKAMIDDTKNCKNAKNVGTFRFERAKKTYRKLAKLIHPDINKKTMEDENLRELWERIVNAYNHSDIDELDDLEVLVLRSLDELGESGFTPAYDDLEERIERIERQINEILTTEPYTYGEILSDDVRKEELKAQLQHEYSNYKEYLEILTNTLDEMLREGGITWVWKLD